jgi:hypothetical protein
METRGLSLPPGKGEPIVDFLPPQANSMANTTASITNVEILKAECVLNLNPLLHP